MKKQDTKLHYKMYKAGKQWIFAAVATAIMGTFATSLKTNADASSQQSNVNTSEVSTDKNVTTNTDTSNNNDGSASIKTTPQVNLSYSNDIVQTPDVPTDSQNNLTAVTENDKETSSNDNDTQNQKNDLVVKNSLDNNQPSSNVKQSVIQSNATNNQSNLPNGIEITSDEIAKPENNNFNQFGTLTVKNVVDVTNTAADINIGDRIKFNVAHSDDAGSDALMKNAINWNAITVTGGEDYGHWSVDKNEGSVDYIFDKQITLTTGYFTFDLNVPFQQASNGCGVVFSSIFQQNGNDYPLNSFYYGYIPIPNNVSPNRVQAPSLLSGLNYADVNQYEGPTANNPIATNNINSTFDPSKGDEPSWVNVAYPTNGNPDSSFNTLTKRTYTVEVQGSHASFDLNGLRFGMPSAAPYELSWSGSAAGTWVTLEELNKLLPGVSVDLNQINENDAKLSIQFPDGATIQYLQFTGNFIAPDVNEKYKVNFGYHDDQGTVSNNSIDETFDYQTNSGGFFPTILAGNKNINVDTFNDADLDNYLMTNVDVTDVQDGKNNDPISIEKNSAYQALKTALINKTTGNYNITYATRNSLKLPGYKTVTVTLYANQQVTDQETVSRTVHYEYSDGSQVPGLNDYSQSADFTRLGERDPLNPMNVTWGPWKSVNEAQTKIDVTNPTYPTIAALKGYHPNSEAAQGVISGNSQENTPIIVTYSPDAETVKVNYVDEKGNTLAPSDNLSGLFGEKYETSAKVIAGYHVEKIEGNTTGTYSTENPDVTYVYALNDETAIVNYVDDVTGKTISTTELSGKFGESIDQSKVKAEIAELKGKGYHEVGSDVPANFADGKQTYTVHFDHSHSAVTTGEGTETNGSLTVSYQYDNGTKAADDITKKVDFTRSGDKDNVTGKIEWNNWTPTDEEVSIDSPEITGYTADQKTVSDDIKPDQAANETVTYTADAETATVNYVDDVTGKTISTTELSGKFGEPIDQSKVKAEIADLESKGYHEVRSDVPAKFADGKQTYTVHFDHSHSAVTTGEGTETSGSMTVHYQYENGAKAADDVTKKVDFTRSGDKDNVTGKIKWNAWTPTDQEVSIDSPEITGYMADRKTVTDEIKADQAAKETVTYAADAETTTVNYVDDVTGKVISATELSGKFGEPIDQSKVKAEIADLESKGYHEVSSDVPAKFADGKQTYTVHFDHSHSAVTTGEGTETSGSMTVHYQYDNGTKAADDVTKKVDFTRTGDKDNVTGKIEWNNWTPTDQEVSIDSPEITGYTADRKTVTDEIKADQSVDETVTYTSVPVPVTPVQPEEPAKPSQPVVPTTPVQPEEPAKPSQPAVPVTPVQPEKPAEPAQTIVSDKAEQPTAVAAKPAAAPKQDALPQTGQNDNTSFMSMIGTILLSLLGLFGIKGLKKKKED